MSPVVAIMLLAGCDVVFHIDTVDPVVEYTYAKTITITQVETETLTDVPISVVIAGDLDLFSHAPTAGFVFRTIDGVALDSEVVSYDPSHGSLEAWVRLPALAPGTTTVQLVYPGPEHDAGQTWSGFEAVWHLTGPDAADASGHAHALVATSTTPAQTAGIIGDARRFDAPSDQLCTAATAQDSLNFGLGSFSYSLWVLVTDPIGSFDAPLAKGGGSVPDPGYDLELGSTPWNSSISDGHTNLNPVLGNAIFSSWVQLAVDIDRAHNVVTTYINGVIGGTLSIAGLDSLTTTKPLCLSITSDPFIGSIDEVRVMAGAHSAAWFATEYANAAERSTFVRVGAESPLH